MSEYRTSAPFVSTAETRYYGKYRGFVINNLDPLNEGRIQVIVPAVSIIPSTWAQPCFPVAGMQYGVFTVPLPLSNVWVEYEQGDPDRPIWTGCLYGSAAEVPAQALTSLPPIPGITLSTTRNSIQVTDGPTGVTLRSGVNMVIVNDAGITLQVGTSLIQISVAGIIINGALVDINKAALTVLGS